MGRLNDGGEEMSVSDQGETGVGTVEILRRFPVKSMLGETHEALDVSARGVTGDRAWAILDEATGKIASAKRAKLWRGLLTCAARTLPGEDGAAIEVALPDGTRHHAGDPALDGRMSALTGRTVRLISVPPHDAEVDRAHPEAQLAEGLDADVASDILKLGAAAPPGTFFDYAPLHLLTTATLDGLATAPGEPAEDVRYRANVVIRSPAGMAGFIENDWVDGTIRIGPSVMLRIVLQTPRCAIPTLAHGALPPQPAALRAAADRNRVEIPGFGNQPCAGVYAAVLQGGSIRHGDVVTFTPA